MVRFFVVLFALLFLVLALAACQEDLRADAVLAVHSLPDPGDPAALLPLGPTVEFLNAQCAALLSGETTLRAVQDAHLGDLPEFEGIVPRDVAASIAGKLSAEPLPGTSLIRVSFQAYNSRADADALLGALAQVFPMAG